MDLKSRFLAHNVWFDNIRFWSGLQTQMESSFAFQSLLSLGGVFANGDFMELEIFRHFLVVMILAKIEFPRGKPFSFVKLWYFFLNTPKVD